MLVLSRKKDEKIMIGDNISVMVIEIRGDKVRLGIDAPQSVEVHRQEVYDAIQKEKEEKRKTYMPYGTGEVTDPVNDPKEYGE